MSKLFYEDSYLKRFSAKVESCVFGSGGYSVLLNQTAFFPTAGGQECDKGTLDGQEVLSVTIENGKIYHLVKNPIADGKTVEGELDWSDRFRKMQHHSAEHIVSGLAFSRFGLNNVGFHLGDSDVTIDYDGEITENQLCELELSANKAVQQNLEIKAYFPEDAELEKISYRSKKEILDKIRLVEICGIDICACCAPHVKRTGEIGIIKFTDMMRHRGGVRIRMVCAEDALFDYDKKQKSVFEISKMLSAPQDSVSCAVLRLLKENAEQKRKNSDLNSAFARLEADAIPKTNGNFLMFSVVCDKNAQRMIAKEGKERVGGVFALLSGDDDAGYSYIIAANDVSEYVKKLNAAFSGKGGGRGDTAEGHFSAKREIIEAEFERILKS